MSTAISWTNETWNPVVGCEPVSAGCDNCYAKALHDMRHRAFLAGKKMLPQYGVPFETVQMKRERLTQPRRWAKPRRVFVNSVSDLFHKDVTPGFLDQCFAVMAFCGRHQFQILTKRPHRMRSYIEGLADRGGSGRGFRRLADAGAALGLALEFGFNGRRIPLVRWPIPNIWQGTSVEHQAAADKRIPQLIGTPAALRFLSCEPLLGPLVLDLTGIHWVIIGGESGARRRTVEIDWIASIVAQCRAADVAVFVKQDSAPKSEQRGRIPDDLWLREFPTPPTESDA